MQAHTIDSKRAERRTPTKRVKLFVSLFLLCFGAYVYVAFSPLCSMWLYNQLLFFPWKYPTGYYNDRVASTIEPRDVWIPIEGLKLHGWYYEKPGAKRTVIIHHGQGGNLTLLRGWAAIFID